MAYCTLQQARRQLENDAVGEDAIKADYLEFAARAIDDITGYWFDERYLTLGFSGEVNSPALYLSDMPLLAVDTLTNGDGTVITAPNYALLPVGQYPKTQLRLAVGTYWTVPLQANALLCTPPLLDSSYAAGAIQIAGRWGFNRRYAQAWRNTNLTVFGAHTTSVTTLNLSAEAGTAFDVGSILKVVIASGAIEYLSVTDPVASSTKDGFLTDAVTVERAYNGSAALAFVGGEVIYVWQPEPTINLAAREIVAAMYKSRDNATGVAFNPGGIGTMTIADIPVKARSKLVWPYFSAERGVTLGR